MKIAIEPIRDEHLADAVRRAGSEVVALDAADTLVWIGGPDGFPELTDTIGWVALATAGIEKFVAADVIDDRRLWTNASGFYAAGVAEHALALLLAGLRQINTAVLDHWAKERIDPAVRTLRGSTVAIIGAGGIGVELTPLLVA
ncbi:MAG: hydroxyacid dehydrogenase, partial [Gordonia sp. (in: high G+C Gram-positive bacteria)]